MAHHKHLIGADGGQHSDNVIDDVEVSVAVDVGGSVRVLVALEVGSHGSVAEKGEGVDLVAPEVPKLEETMKEENDWTFSFLREVNVDAIGLYNYVMYSLHFFVSPNSRFQIPNPNFNCFPNFPYIFFLFIDHR